MANFDYIELRRQGDDLVYQFDRRERENGAVGYKRRDAEHWIVFDQDFGWVARLAEAATQK
jgi:hypothetical protein